MSVAAPVRTSTVGHSTSVADSSPVAASPVVAFDDVLKRSRADVLNMLVEPHPARSSVHANTGAGARHARIFKPLRAPTIFFSRVFQSRSPRAPVIAIQAWQPKGGRSIDVVLDAPIEQMILPDAV